MNTTTSNRQNPKKYWYSWRGNAFGPRGLPIPTVPQGWYAILVFILILLGAAFLFLPLKGNPTRSQLVPFVVIAVVDIIVFIVVGTLKQEPKPPKSP